MKKEYVHCTNIINDKIINQQNSKQLYPSKLATVGILEQSRTALDTFHIMRRKVHFLSL